MKKIIIDLLRHGDVAGGQRLRGKTDDPLSKLGWQQMNAVIEGKTIPWQKIISSDLRRCQDFSIEISKQLSLPIEVSHHFQEIDFGLWDGQLLSKLYEGNDSEHLFQFMQSPSSIAPPEGEAYEHFRARILDEWQRLLIALNKENIGHCVLITHGGVIRCILSEILGIPEHKLLRLEVPHACLSRVTQYEHSPTSLSFHQGALLR
ncbi:histidine phosphatase family protein [Pseudomonadota bacterium]|nr:histidine phosphatase family protein [Pseudomonadota bacterium]